MNSFFTLVGYEYIKLFKRKATIVSVILVFLIMILVCLASITANTYWHLEEGAPLLEAMKLDKEVTRSKAGVIDEAFLNEAIAKNTIMISNDENYTINDYGKFLKSQAYIEYALPYEKAVAIINTMYEPDFSNLSTDGYQIFNIYGIKPIDSMESLHEKDFYEKIKQVISKRINNRETLSDAEKEKHMQMLSQVEIPFYNDYFGAYSRFTKISQVISLTLLVAIAVCISPIFAGEYQSKTDQILLSAKYGKNRDILAKLFTGISFALVLATIIMSGCISLLLVIHGSEGSNMVIQTLNFFSTYPITVLQSVLIAIAVTIFITMSFSMYTMLLSSCFRSPFSAVIVSFLTIFVPAIIFISPQNRLLYQLIQIFPAKATDFSNVFSEYFFEISGVVFTPATFYIIFATVTSIMIVPFAYHTFKNHQIG